jgi:hypothetical protein
MSAHQREQQLAKARIVEKFGRGPYLFEFQLRIWGADNIPTEHFFTVELAPIDLMPISTHFFLEQVSQRLWDGTTIYLNADHVIGARPWNGDGTSKLDAFHQAGLATLPLIEYSPHYPHMPYTMAYSGGGPNLYLNKRHNVHHQYNDPCFAEVVIGRSTVDAMAGMKGHAHDPKHIRPIDIVAVRRATLQDLNESAAKEYLAVKAAR